MKTIAPKRTIFQEQSEQFSTVRPRRRRSTRGQLIRLPDNSISKPCSKCGRILPISMFTIARRQSTGFRSNCKDCKRGGPKILSERKKARLLGLKRYWGRPCKFGHSGERWVYKGVCIKCHAAQLRNSERYQATKREYNKNLHPDKRRIRGAVRRARLKQAQGRYTKEDIQYLLTLQKRLCVYCNKELIDNNYHADHIIPLSKNGTNFFSNIQVCCRSCNLGKHDRDPVEFAQIKGTPLVCDLPWK